MTISNWPISERPREKLLVQGAKHLSDAELLAILLQTGIRGKTALDMARELLSEFGNLKNVLTGASPAFYQKPGLGKAKYAMLKAALELGRRYSEEPLTINEVLTDSMQTKRCLAGRLKDYPHEVFACLFLDTQHRVLGFEELFHGTLNEANVYPREVVKLALAYNAAKVIFAHNHPSGNPMPSQADQAVTKLLREALSLVEILLIDHIVIGKECLSFAEMGLL